MDYTAIKDQNLIDALTPKMETLSVSAHEASVSIPIGGVLAVVSLAGTKTGPLTLVFTGTPTTGQCMVDRTNKKFVFAAADAVTACYVEYHEGFEDASA